MRRRGLSEMDRAAWASYARLVMPMPGIVVPEPPPPVAVAPATPPAAPVPSAPRQGPPPPLVVGHPPGGVDAATWKRFRTGKLPAVRTLDLHGRTAQRAHIALEHFLHTAAAEGVRCVEVITGRGRGEGTGVIRREFPIWLNAPHLRHLVLAAAHPHEANTGSVRLLLRRTRR